MQLLYDFLISTMAIIRETWMWVNIIQSVILHCIYNEPYKKENKCYTFYDY